MANGAIHLFEVYHLLLELDSVCNNMGKGVQRQIKRNAFASLDLECRFDSCLGRYLIKRCWDLAYARSQRETIAHFQVHRQAPRAPMHCPVVAVERQGDRRNLAESPCLCRMSFSG